VTTDTPRRRKSRHRHRAATQQRNRKPSLDGMIEALWWPVLLGTITVSALMFGGVDQGAQLLSILGLSLLMVMTAVRSVRKGVPIATHWILIPMLALVGLVLLQVAPLGAGLVGTLSPQARQWWDSVGGTARLSLYPNETWNQLRVLMMALVVFFLTLQGVRTRASLVRALVGVTIMGMIVVGLALAQDLSGATKIFWVGPDGKGGVARSGPFIHYSHYGQFVNLAICCCVAWALVTLVRVQREQELSPKDLLKRLFLPECRALLLTLLFLPAAVFTLVYSSSRTATIALGAAMVPVVILVSQARILRGRAWWVFPPAMLAVGVSGVLALQVYMERLAALNSFEPYEQRVDIARDSMQLWKQFPLVGTGLGSFSVVFPMVDTSAVNEAAIHAENQYVHLMTETGVLGVACGVAVIGGLLWMSLRSSIRPRHSIQMAAIGLFGAVLCSAIHAMSDFALHLPANAMLMALVAALVVALPRIDDDVDTVATPSLARPAEGEETTQAVSASPGISKGLIVTWCVVGAATLLLLGNGAYASTRAQGAMITALEDSRAFVDRQWDGSDTQYTALLLTAQAATQLAPGNAEYAYRLNVFRWYALARERSADGTMALTPTLAGHLERLVDELKSVRKLAPTFASPVVLMEQVERLRGNTKIADDLMGLRFQLNRGDGGAGFERGKQLVAAGNWTDAVPMFHRALQRYVPAESVFQFVVVEHNNLQVASELAGADVGRMRALSAVLKSNKQTDVAARLDDRIYRELGERVTLFEAQAADFAELAEMAASRGDWDVAIKGYVTALNRNYDNISWRIALARIYLEQGRLVDAQGEADRLENLASENREVKQLRIDVLTRVESQRLNATTQPAQ
jgi:O-antigen ligase/tetratricopeptide (TPR) repeat protein